MDQVTRRLAVLAIAPVTLWAAWHAAGAFAEGMWIGTRIITMVPLLAVPFIVTALVVGTRGAYGMPRITPVRATAPTALVPALPQSPVTVHATVTDLPPVRQEIGAR